MDLKAEINTFQYPVKILKRQEYENIKLTADNITYLPNFHILFETHLLTDINILIRA